MIAASCIMFNGIHLALVMGALVVGFACGAAYGWLLRDERGDKGKEGRT